MDRWGENASMLPSISILSSSIFVVRCPVTLGSWNVISLQVMEITNVPGAQAGSIPLASLVGCYGALLLFCCSLCWHHISWPAFGTGSTFRRRCLNLASSLLVPQTEFRARGRSNRTTVRYRKRMSKFRDIASFFRERVRVKDLRLPRSPLPPIICRRYPAKQTAFSTVI